MENKYKDRVSFSIKETAQITGVDYRTIHRNLDKIPHSRLGSRILIKRSYIDSLMGAEQ